MNTAICLTDSVLRSYALGDCDDRTRDLVEKHLVQCQRCEETLAELDDTTDSLVRHLPLVAGNPEMLDGAEAAPGWLERLRGGPLPSKSLEIKEDGSGPGQEVDETKLGRSAYELLGILGRGGMSIVYRARHRQLDRVVAFKVLDPRLTAAVEARRRFDREIRILGNLRHPGIVMATDAGRIGSAAYLVMELVDGVDLSRLVHFGGPLSVAEACEAGRQIALALEAAHRAGVVHRDLKPSNVMADPQGHIKLLDFGLAQLAPLSGDHAETSLGRLLGTLAYMAPEQAALEGSLDHRADLYGLGGTLLFLLTGRPPRDGSTRQSLVEQLRTLTDDRLHSIRSLRADLPEELVALIDRLLHPDPAERGDSAEAVAQQLSRWAAGNLASRVEEAQEQADTPVNADSEALARSLSQLLALVPGEGVSEIDGVVALSPSSRNGSSTTRRIGWLAVLGTAAAVAWFGITILIQTPEGTVRIESEDGGLRVNMGDAASVEVLSEAPLYQGRPAAVWQRRFDSERDPMARMEAARALVTLAGDLPSEEQLNRLVQVGAAMLESGWGDEVWNPTLQIIGRAKAGDMVPRWPQSKELTAAYSDLHSLLRRQFAQQPPVELVERLCRVLLEDEELSAAFAASMLADFSVSPGDGGLRGDRQAVRRMNALLDVPVEGLGRTAVAALLTATLHDRVTEEAGTRIAARMNELAVQLGEPTADELRRRMRTAWLIWAQRGAPVDTTFAAMLLRDELLDFRIQTLSSFFESRWFSGEFPHSSLGIQRLRESGLFFLPAWLTVVNRHLEQAGAEGMPLDQESIALISSLRYVLRAMQEGDNWDIATTGRLLTERLRHLHASSELDLRAVPELTPAALLTLIVWMEGAIPEFAKGVPPAMEEPLDLWNRVLESGALDPPERRQLESLIELAPYRAVELLVQSRERFEPRSTLTALEWIGPSEYYDGIRGQMSELPSLDALLLLAILADLSGQSVDQDERIAMILGESHPARRFRRHLRDLLGQRTAIVPKARALLRQVSDRATSERLREAAEALLLGGS